MADPLHIKLDDLRVVLGRVLDLTEARLGPELTLDVDYYWHLPVEQAFDMTGQPKTFTVGQVSDDLAETIHDGHGHVPEEAWHDLSHLIGVLRALELRARS